MNLYQKIENLNAFKYIKHPLEKLLKINFSCEEMVDLLKNSINKKDWLKVAKCITWIQRYPDMAYVDSLCLLLKEHYYDFHPEEVIDALDEIVELPQVNDNLIKIAEALTEVCCLSHDDDPNYNINKKCILILFFMASLNHNISQNAIDGLIKASNSDIPKVSDEAKTCLNDLDSAVQES